MNIQQALARTINRQDLAVEEMISVMRDIMTGQVTPAQTAGFLVALRMKGESLDEITGAAMVMRELVAPVAIDVPHLVDTCGTGGDGAGLFNISTAAAFVAAAAGAHVAKHGNRSVSSATGSADVLEAAGVQIELSATQVATCVREVGLGFMFAPAHHSAMKHANGPRKELGQRTLFNMLGPLTNPANVRRQVIGVFNGDLCRPLAEVLGRLGSEHVLVVHARDGLDEISLATETQVAELKDGVVKEFFIKPEDFGVSSQSLVGLSVDNAEQSLTLIRAALTGGSSAEAQKAADIIALNAGAAIYVAGIARDLGEGVVMAQDIVASGLAMEKLNELVMFTDCMGDLS